MKPYFEDETVRLYVGDCREILPELGEQFDCAAADPPYGETSLAWDRWPDGWPAAVAAWTSSLWCFGSMRMFLDRRDEFAGWRLSQDVVWEKHTGSSALNDRFRRTHEHATHWYRGTWAQVHHEALRVAATDEQIARNGSSTRRSRPAQWGDGQRSGWTEDGTRLMGSVLHVKSMRGRAIHHTEKPVELLDPLIRYACPPGGTVLDPFAGSASTAAAARLSGRRAVLIEADERYAEKAAQRLQQTVLPLEVG